MAPAPWVGEAVEKEEGLWGRAGNAQRRMLAFSAPCGWEERAGRVTQIACRLGVPSLEAGAGR